MPAKEIKELRQAGKLNEAFEMAQLELLAEPDNIWGKRNISWVYYELLKENTTPDHYETFLMYLKNIKDLELPSDQNMLYDKISWQLGKLGFAILKSDSKEIAYRRFNSLFEVVKSFYFSKPSESYSFLFKVFHKAFKDTFMYQDFADWWNFENFRPEDYQEEKMPNGKGMMALAEQGYIAYAKSLLPKEIQITEENIHLVNETERSEVMMSLGFGNPVYEIVFDRQKIELFLMRFSTIIEEYPQFQYPPYFKAKLLLTLGNNENMLSALLPFARRKRNDFWVWDVLSEAYQNDPDKVLACYCKALSCKSPEEMLVNLRQRMAKIFIDKELYNEAKTEIELLVNARQEKDFKIPNEVAYWQNEDWFKQSMRKNSNFDFYRQHLTAAEVLLFGDIQEDIAVVDFVNSDKKIVNFITSDAKSGFFKYGRFLEEVKMGDILKIRFQEFSKEAISKVYTVSKTNDEQYRAQFFKEIEGEIRIGHEKSFGFIGDIYIHPTIVAKWGLKNAQYYKGMVMKSFNSEKKQWCWKLISVK